MSATTVSLWRWGLSSICVYCCFPRAIHAAWPWLRKHFIFFLVASAAVVIPNVFIYDAAHYTTAMNMGLLSGTSPLFIMVFSHFLLKERMGWGKVIGSLVALVGVLFLITKGQLQVLYTVVWNYGDILMLLAMIGGGVYAICSRKIPPQIPLMVFLFYVFAISTLSLIPVYFLSENEWIPHYSATRWGELIFTALGPGVLGFICWGRAILMIGASMAGILYFSLPPLTALLAVFLLGERFQGYHAVSFIIVTAGMLCSILWTQKAKSLGKPTSLGRK